MNGDTQFSANSSYLKAVLEFHGVECVTLVIFRQAFCLTQLVELLYTICKSSVWLLQNFVRNTYICFFFCKTVACHSNDYYYFLQIVR